MVPSVERLCLKVTSKLCSVTARWPSKWPHALQNEGYAVPTQPTPLIKFFYSFLLPHSFICTANLSLRLANTLKVPPTSWHVVLPGKVLPFWQFKLDQVWVEGTRMSWCFLFPHFFPPLGFSSMSVVSLQSHVYFWLLSCSVQHPFLLNYSFAAIAKF